MRSCQGYTLIELVAVLIIIAILGTAITLRSLPSSTMQLQASRDVLVAAFFSAQQQAMAQTRAVRLITESGSIDVRVDVNSDAIFSASESVTLAGVQYPIALIPSQNLSSAQFDFDRLGRTTANRLTLSQSGTSVTIDVSINGAISF